MTSLPIFVSISSEEMSDEMVPKNLSTIGSLSEFDAFALASPRSLHVLFFWASWDTASAPGGAMWRLISTLAALHGDISFARVEAEEVADVSEQLNVAAVPTVVFLRGGRVIERVEGARAADVTSRLEALGAAGSAGDDAAAGDVPASLTALKARIRALTTAAPIMLFMKGSPTEPKCGFSRKMVDLLRAEGASFGSFDILTDKAVREGLRDYGQWPTYPQVRTAARP
jgi:glutaredoxin-related protein